MRRIFAFGVLLVACASTPSKPVALSTHAKRPFTASEIQKAMPIGTEIKMRVEADGSQPVIRSMFVIDADQERVALEHTTVSEAGDALGEPARTEESWNALVEHATFPRDRTQIDETSIEVPIGKFPAWLYTVEETDLEGHPLVKRYWFAKSLPGPPVRFETERMDTKVIVLRVTIIHYVVPKPEEPAEEKPPASS